MPSISPTACEVMEHLGHTKISTTIDTYGHLFPQVRQRIRENRL